MFHVVSIAIMEWSVEQCVFCVQTCLLNARSIVRVQHGRRLVSAGRDHSPQSKSFDGLFARQIPRTGRLISLKVNLNWPARSPDLAPCIFFLWGYLKSLVYNDHPRTLEALKNNIRTQIAEIPVAMLQSVHKNFRKGLLRVWRDSLLKIA